MDLHSPEAALEGYSPRAAQARRRVLRNAAGVGIATGTYGLSFGALSIASGLSLTQTCVLSLLMFSGSAQFGLVGVVGSGGSPVAGVATGALLASRNALYGLRLSRTLNWRGLRRLAAAHLVIDESAAMSIAEPAAHLSRLAFRATGLAVFCCWNIATLLGALGARILPDPRVLGLDVVAPAAFVALIFLRLRSAQSWLAAAASAAVALATAPAAPAGTPVLFAATVVTAYALWVSRTPVTTGAMQEGSSR